MRGPLSTLPSGLERSVAALREKKLRPLSYVITAAYGNAVIGLIGSYPFSAPYEEIRLKPR